MERIGKQQNQISSSYDVLRLPQATSCVKMDGQWLGTRPTERVHVLRVHYIGSVCTHLLTGEQTVSPGTLELLCHYMHCDSAVNQGYPRPCIPATVQEWWS